MKSLHNLRLIAVAFALCALSACAAIGPASSPEYPNLVNNAVPTKDGKVLLFGPGHWFPNAIGFTDLRSTWGFGKNPSSIGVCVITDKSLLFLQWYDAVERFEIVKRIANSDIMSASLDSFGVSRRMVVRKQDYSYDSFDFTNDSGTLLDIKKIETATTLLRDNALGRATETKPKTKVETKSGTAPEAKTNTREFEY